MSYITTPIYAVNSPGKYLYSSFNSSTIRIFCSKLECWADVADLHKVSSVDFDAKQILVTQLNLGQLFPRVGALPGGLLGHPGALLVALLCGHPLPPVVGSSPVALELVSPLAVIVVAAVSLRSLAEIFADGAVSLALVLLGAGAGNLSFLYVSSTGVVDFSFYLSDPDSESSS